MSAAWRVIGAEIAPAAVAGTKENAQRNGLSYAYGDGSIDDKSVEEGTRR